MKKIGLMLVVNLLCGWIVASAQSIPPSLHARIIQLEDERNLNGDELAKLLKHASPKVRERAALAIGRIGDKRGTAALIDLLQSEKNESVRAMTAFALGEMEDAQAVPALMAVLEAGKAAPAVRARVAEALGKIITANNKLLGDATIEQINARLIEQLPDPKAALTADEKLLARLTIVASRARFAVSVEARARQLKSNDADIRALAARGLGGNAALPVLLDALKSDDAVVRANAARALAAMKDARAIEPLIGLLHNQSEHQQVDAIRALARLGDKRAVELLIELSKAPDQKSPSPPSRVVSRNLQLEIASALGALQDERALPSLLELRRSFSPQAVPEIEIAIARLDKGRTEAFQRGLSELTKDACHNWEQAAVAAQTIDALLPTKDQHYWEIAFYELAYGLLSKVDKPGCDQRSLPGILQAYSKLLFSPEHSSFLQSLKSRDVEAKESQPAGFLPYLHKKLQSDDVNLRATVAAILGDQAKEESFELLVAALKRSRSDKSNDAKLAILTALSKYKSEKAIEAIKTALNDSDHLVRRRAVALLKQMDAGDFSDRIGIVQTSHDKLFYQRVIARMNRKVTATIHTAKGAITMELYPAEAPITVDSFITLARKDYFNNLTFHRVVPNFVVQGGDPRGDGEGGPGYQIRCEVNMRPYVRGAVGMALSGKDTGGSQFFITHSPQPHLDGGYTVFGQVTRGMEVVDRIARGDIIKRIEIVER